MQQASDKQIRQVLTSLASELMAHSKELLKENAKDLSRQAADDPRNDRLLLNEQRIKSISGSIKNVIIVHVCTLQRCI